MHSPEERKLRVQLALDAAYLAVWESTIHDGQVDRGEVIWDGQGANLLGLTSNGFRQSYCSFLEFLHPDDRSHVRDVMQNAVERFSDYLIEYRVVWADATVHWIAAKGRVYAGPDGNPERTLGILSDVTERKEAQIALAEQKELAEITLGSIGDGVITTNVAGETQYLNRMAEKLTGWSCEAAKGVPIDKVFRVLDESTGELFENAALACLASGMTSGISAHARLIGRNERQIPIQDSVAPIRSKDGRLHGAVVVFQDVSIERQLKHELSWQAMHDELTGLINRREFELQLDEALASTKKHGESHGLLFLDLDQFKIVNDTCGHIAGDELLRQLTAMLQSHMRDRDILARLGGDEMAVLLLNCPIEQAQHFAEGLRQAVNSFRFVWKENIFEIGASIGLVAIDATTISALEAMSAADRACYVAKEQGRNRVHLFQESDAALVHRHGEMLWVTRLNHAFEYKRFRLYAQPIATLNGTQTQHMEVLLRMNGEHGELVSPGTFIPAAERYNKMPAIDRWVIETCFDFLHRQHAWHDERQTSPDANPADAVYSINLSGNSLDDDLLLQFISDQFQRHVIAPGQICFEITETAAIGNLLKAKRFVAELKKMGCQFSLDDFGSGLSSFSYLKNFPVDFLKIDGSFVKDVVRDPISRAMVASINHVGHVMGIKTIAEFVETDEILAEIRDIGVDYAQGFAVGHAQPMMLRENEHA